MGAEGPLVGPPVFKTDGDGAPVLVCSIRTRPRHGLRTALLARGSAGMAKPLSRAGRFFASNRDPRCWLGGRPAGVGWKQGLFCGKECAVMSSIPFFARRRLCSTFNAQEVGQLRAALQGAGVEFVIQQDRQNGSFFGIGLQLVPPSVEYIIYVHEDDFELAQAALQGTLN